MPVSPVPRPQSSVARYAEVQKWRGCSAEWGKSRRAVSSSWRPRPRGEPNPRTCPGTLQPNFPTGPAPRCRVWSPRTARTPSRGCQSSSGDGPLLESEAPCPARRRTSSRPVPSRAQRPIGTERPRQQPVQPEDHRHGGRRHPRVGETEPTPRGSSGPTRGPLECSKASGNSS